MYFLIITLGFLLAMRGSRPAPLQRPAEGLERVWREAADLFLTTGLVLTLESAVVVLEMLRVPANEYKILTLGIATYLLSRYQKKTDVFFLVTVAIVFLISSRQSDLLHGLSLAWAACVGIALFQTGFLGLRYKLLFSRTPGAMKGWPLLCLLAAFLSVLFGGIGHLVF